MLTVVRWLAKVRIEIGLVFAHENYQLLDFGDGRKLERFGAVILDRPASAAKGPIRSQQVWESATSRYVKDRGGRGHWMACQPLPDPWVVSSRVGVFQLKLSESGNVGLFPEHALHWEWMLRRLRAHRGRPTVLNLFAYTGAATLAAASAGAQVVHVDAARSTIAWARENARCSGLASAPIRWICEDAMQFVARELKRGCRYDAVLVDPPSYGHGPRGQAWKLQRDLDELLDRCAQLLEGRHSFFLLTCHTTGIDHHQLRHRWQHVFHQRPHACIAGGSTTSGTMRLNCDDGRKLSCGSFVRWWVKLAT